ncbi:hypothetical protein DFQ27_000315 [Actinomortierella ambigua]|uniref:Uncharacterized protein n=1 Tax=Actinomortierella ambigua TaxID=1343610 RepID=A0A9P6QH81_9FUNG|nr:hypothetical protein DFQ27_000315 [Actinomortierella ambigua]
MKRRPRSTVQTFALCTALLLTALGTLLQPHQQQRQGIVAADLVPPRQHHHHHHHHPDQRPADPAKSPFPDLRLALTSLNDRLIAYQYTEPAPPPTTTMPAEPTEAPAPKMIHHSHQRKIPPGSGSGHGSAEPDHTHKKNDDDPPEPLPPWQEGDNDGPCPLGEQATRADQPATATERTSHPCISSLAQPLSPSTIMSHEIETEEDIPINVAQVFSHPTMSESSSSSSTSGIGSSHSQYLDHSIPFSPREQLEPATTAATTIQFSTEPKGDQPRIQKVDYTAKNHGQEEEAREEEKERKNSLCHTMDTASIAPEPTLATIQAPTSTSTTTTTTTVSDRGGRGGGGAADHRAQDERSAHDRGSMSKENAVTTPMTTMTNQASPTGPPMPTPEPTATEEDPSIVFDTGDDDDRNELPGTIVAREAQIMTGRSSKGGQDSVGGAKAGKRVVRKVTTLIIETMTIIRHPPKETLSMHRQRLAKEDHVLFDSGIEGDMIVSIVNQEEAKAKNKKTTATTTGKTAMARTMTTTTMAHGRGRVNDEL